MKTDIHGWCGKILRVDLSDGNISEIDTMQYAERFLGGRGIATRIYWETVKPGISAFDPQNHMILMTGPLGATGVQGASRLEAAGKSPMTVPEGFCYGNIGGYFGPTLKRAGFDGVVILGKSETPVYLRIENDAARLHNAAHLWGKGVYDTAEALRKTHGPEVRFLTTGVAGENRCRTATLMTENEGSLTGGFGAVFGAKNLKAVAVSGTKSPAVADPAALKELTRQTIQLTRRDPPHLPFPPQTAWRTGKTGCYQCGLDCFMRNTVKTASGKTMVRKCQSMFVYFPWVMGRKGESVETALDATGVCNDLSLCTMEMYNVIQWLVDGYKAGYLNDQTTGLEIDRLGTFDFFVRLAYMIAHRRGFGDVLAEGLLRAGETLGEAARAHFNAYVSDVGDGANYSAREYPQNGLLYAMEPRQPIAALHEASRLVGFWVMNRQDPKSSPVTNEVFRKAAARFWKHDKAWDFTTIEGKAETATHTLDRTYVKDSLLLCDSNWPVMFTWHTPDRVGDPTLESRTFTAVTGVETDETELQRYGERIFNLQRAVLLREGRRPPAGDIIPEFNFTEPVQTVFMNPEVIVPGEGDAAVGKKETVMDRADYRTMLREFYELRGWDTETGMPTQATLEALDLADIVPELTVAGETADETEDAGDR